MTPVEVGTTVTLARANLPLLPIPKSQPASSLWAMLISSEYTSNCQIILSKSMVMMVRAPAISNSHVCVMAINPFNLDGKTGWQKMTNLGAALPGTELACTSFKRTDLSIRVYYQVSNLSIIEKAYDASKGWYTGGLTIPSLPPRAALGCTSFNAGPTSISLRVYYSTTGDNDNLLKEKAYDNGPWYDGGFVQHCIPGSKGTVIQWGSGSGLNLRVYFQNGTKVTGVSEWMWIGKWVKGQDAIPPA
jgi:Fungal fucose-specific lectin